MSTCHASPARGIAHIKTSKPTRSYETDRPSSSNGVPPTKPSRATSGAFARGNEIWGSVVARRHLADPTLELHRYRTAIVVHSIANPPKLVAPWPPSDQMAPCSLLAVDGNCPIGGRQFSRHYTQTQTTLTDGRTPDSPCPCMPAISTSVHRPPQTTTGHHRPLSPQARRDPPFIFQPCHGFDVRLSTLRLWGGCRPLNSFETGTLSTDTATTRLSSCAPLFPGPAPQPACDSESGFRLRIRRLQCTLDNRQKAVAREPERALSRSSLWRVWVLEI